MSKSDQAAVVLLSGGLDSVTALAITRAEGYRCYALTFDYGQRHRVELEMAAKQAELHGAAEHRTVAIDLRSIGGSALTADIDVPKEGGTEHIPVTYVPARNTIFLSIALGWAEVLGLSDLVIGVNALDYSGYPDCRPEFIHAFESLANVATKAGVEGRRFRIHSPLIHMSKAEIIQAGRNLGVKYEWTTSCYDPDHSGKPCLKCDSCRIRAAGFQQVGVDDPLLTRFDEIEWPTT